MPARYLKEQIRESERLNALPWPAVVAWFHLLVTVDDFGRCEASLRLLRPKLFPLRLEQVRETDLERWLHELQTSGLVRLYTVAGKTYLQMEKWEKGRANQSKFPDPPPASSSSLPPLPRPLSTHADADTCLPPPTDADICTQPHANPPTTITTTTANTNTNTDTTIATATRATTRILWSPPHGWQGILADDRAEWLKAFPACDLERQLAAMHAWLLANPARAKKSNWRKFITAWLTRSQDRGGDLHPHAHPHLPTAHARTAAARDAAKTGLIAAPIATRLL